MLASALRLARPLQPSLQRLRPIQGCWGVAVPSARTLAVTAAPPPPPPASSPPPPPPPGDADDTPKKEKTGFFLVDHAGSIGFALALSFLASYIWRSKRGIDNRDSLREAIDGERAVCPEEIAAIRRQARVTPDDYAAFVTACAEEFPDGAATIDEFEALLLRVLGRGFPGRVIPGHHHFERAYLTVFRPPEAAAADAGDGSSDGEGDLVPVQPAAGSGDDGRDAFSPDARSRAEAEWRGVARQTQLPVKQLLVLYSFLVDAEASSRMYLLMDLFNTSPRPAATPPPTDDDATGPSADSVPSHISLVDLEALLDDLILTWQLPTKTRIREAEQYPYPTYVRKTSSEHLQDGIRQAKVWEDTGISEELTYADAHAVLCTKAVCLWNECVPTRKKK